MKNNIQETFKKHKEELQLRYLQLLREDGKFNELKQIRADLKSLEKRLQRVAN